MITKKGTSPANKLDIGKSLETNSKNPIKYNNGNFTKSIAANFALFPLQAAILKRLTVNKKLAIAHRLANKKPAPQENLPNKIKTTVTAKTSHAVSPSDFFNNLSNSKYPLKLAVFIYCRNQLYYSVYLSYGRR